MGGVAVTPRGGMEVGDRTTGEPETIHPWEKAAAVMRWGMAVGGVCWIFC